VSVSVRLRPASDASSAAAWRTDDGRALCLGGREYRGFLSSVVCGSEQAEAYDAIAAPLLEELRRGYSCTLLAYGQTGSGKTHTVFGPPGSLTEASLDGELDGDGAPRQWGLLPRIALSLLQQGTATVHASAIEIYGDAAFDLLADRAPLSVGVQRAGRAVGGGPTCTTSSGNGAATDGAVGADLAVNDVHPPACRCGKCFLAKKEELAARLAKRDARQTKGAPRDGASAPVPSGKSQAAGGGRRGGGGREARADEEVSTIGETRVELRTPADVASLSRTVELTRVAVGHALNARSSRSHCFVHLHVSERARGAGGAETVVARTLVCVDLAGSERILRTGVEGLAQRQAVGINSSLTALGKVGWHGS
jgi:hypothetical protein